MELPLLLPVGIGQLVERAHPHGAGVVHQRIDAAEPLQALGHDALAGVGLGHVDREVRAPRHGEHGRALFGEHARGGEPDAAARAGHDARLPVQTEIHREMMSE